MEDIENYRKSLDEKYLLDIFKNHLFFYYIAEIRHLGYNEYQLDTGELLTVDLDRASFAISDTVNIKSLTFCHICKIDQATLENLQDAVEDSSLTATLQHSLLYDQVVFSSSNSRMLQARIEDSLLCIDKCISTYGYKDVIISN